MTAPQPLPGIVSPFVTIALLRLEGLVAAIIAIAVYRTGGGGWIQFGLFFFVPDLSMLGYLAGSRFGAIIYNFAHTYLTPAAVLLTGVLVGGPRLTSIALIWACHIGVDRAFGFGLKSREGFKFNHLTLHRPIELSNRQA